ncbi:MAG: O-antigen ligase family protein [Patescibacteria group bacterium]|jgi:hypothetical protein
MRIKWYASWLAILLAVEGLSWLVYSYPSWKNIVLGIILLLVLLASLYRLHYGIAGVLAELVIGSQGHLIGQLRLGIFLVIMLATIVWIIRDKQIRFFKTNYWKWWVGLVGVFGLAVLTALIYHNDPAKIFLDMNGYLFIAMVIPFVQAVKTEQDIKNLFTVLLAGVTVLAIQSVFILFLYSHPGAFGYYLPELYRWVRDFRLAEVTVQANHFTRVFFQSHIYVLLAFIFTSTALLLKHRAKYFYVLSVVTVSLLVLSYSRSFWVATGLIIIIFLIFFKQRLYYLLIVGSSAIIGYMFILAIINVPLFSSGSGVDAASLLSDRTSDVTTEAASGSRLALLKPLALAALQHPLLGSGFGTTVTYQTKDPRALTNNQSGWFTTFAFEWGYLDLWLKLGLVGVLLYVSIITALSIRLFSQNNLYSLTAGLGVVALAFVHMLTPYLNHPLGLGWIALALSISTVYDQSQS